MKSTKHSILTSALTMLVCLCMFVGSTFAWFSDSVTSSNNIIQSGTLDLEMYWTDNLDTGTWYNVEDAATNTVFSYDNWEPGYTDVRYIKIKNVGNLALNYQLAIEPQGKVGKLAEVINVYFANEGINIQTREDLNQLGTLGFLNHVMNGGATASGTLLPASQQSPLHDSGEIIVTMAMSMITSAGNEYQDETIGDGFTIKALATQASYEKDSFDELYDNNAELPESLKGDSASGTVTSENGVVTQPLTLKGKGVTAYVPAGVLLEDGVTQLELTVTPLKSTTSDITVVNNEVLIPVDVHIEGISQNNTTPIIIDLGEVLPKYLNMGNYHLYHVEGNNNNEMALVDTKEELNAHNQYTYDLNTGAVTLAMATFSEVAIIADTENAWEGKFDYTWYDASKTEYTIANADQLAAFGAIVGGMYKDENENIIKDSFADKTVKLISDINLGDKESENNPDLIFYPIGYYNSTGSYEKTSGGSVTSSVSSFEGTFDGNGHTISNFYQNTWEMFGDYNDGYSGTPNYYKDAMGLFGYVYGGTVKNLTVDHFSSDGEYTPTGVIAAYADGNSTFENIAITNCNPRVYNTGNGGIIGIAGDTSDANDDHITLKNITVDNSNKISALWGSWDVACGGLVGMYRGNVDGSGNATGDTISFENCHVSAIIDVYNDVCANYQYYAYRYSGMIIGSVRHNTKNAEGKTIPNMTGISASGCTVNYGDWNDYYYCEFEKNTMASYSEDYQFSRVPHSELKFTDSNGNGVVDADERASVTGCKHNHTAEENHQAIYLPFHQLFTGYSWGVSSIGIEELDGIENITVSIGEEESVVKFKTKFTGDFLYRVGNKNTVSLGSLFAAKDGANINNSGVVVSVDKMDEDTNVLGTFNANTTDWTEGTIQFSGTGVVKVTIQDYNFCTPTELYLEVVDAYNVTNYTELKNRNSVLLNDISISSNGTFYLNNSTLYGNGFIFDVVAAKDGDETNGYIGGNYAVGLKDATLDNIKIIGEVYTKYGAQAKSMYNYPTILTNGNTVIANSYVSNGSSAIRAQDGDLEIINTTLEGGIFANLDIRGGIVTLDNVVTINQSDANGNSISNDKGIVGLGIVFYECNLNAKLHVKTNSDGTPRLKQYNNISEKVKFNDAFAETLRSSMFLPKYEDLQYIEDGITWINPCILSITEGVGVDNIDTIAGYIGKEAIVNGSKGYVYTLVPTNIENPSDYESLLQYNVLPTLAFDHENEENYKAPTQGSNEFCYYNKDTKQLEISFDEGNKKVYNPNILNISKVGGELKYTVAINGVDYTNKTITFNETGTYKAVYNYTDPYNYKLNEKGEIVKYSVAYKKELVISVTAVKATAKNAKFTFYGYSSISTTAAETITDVKTVISASGNTYIMPSSESSYVTSTKIDGITVNCPRVYVDFKNNTSDFNWLYPVFLGVKIEDYANGGTNTDPDVIVEPKSTIKPTNLTILTTDKPSGGGGWSSGSGKSGREGTLSSGIYKGLYGWTGGAIGSDQNANSIYAQFTYKDNKGTTYYYVIEFYRQQHDCPSSCVTPDTLITLANGTQKRIDMLNLDDKVIAWDFFKGDYVEKDISILVNHGKALHDVIYTKYSDGTTLKLIGEHGVFDYDLNKFVYITANNVKDYVGHRFVKQNLKGGYKTVVMTDGFVKREYEEAWSISSEVTSNAFASGLLTVAPPEDFYNWIEMNGKLQYDVNKFNKDVEKYGLYTYDVFKDYVTYDQFLAWNGAYLKIPVEKGYFDFEYILELINLYKIWMK